MIIVLSVWFVYPAYTNGSDGVKEKKQKLNEQIRLSDNLDNQISNIGKLAAYLKANTDQNAVVFDYIPKNKEEEKLIENLSLLAKDSGLSVLNISVFEMKSEEPTPSPVLPPVAPAEVATPEAASPVVPAQVLATTKIAPKKVRVDFSVFGDYGGIKVLVEKIQKANRFNKFSTLEIKTLLTEEQLVSESLSAKMVLEFNYLKELTSLAEGDIDNPIFSAVAFDRQIMDEIGKKKNIDIRDVLPGQKGTANPFLMLK
jgi:hypothetical protein